MEAEWLGGHCPGVALGLGAILRDLWPLSCAVTFSVTSLVAGLVVCTHYWRSSRGQRGVSESGDVGSRLSVDPVRIVDPGMRVPAPSHSPCSASSLSCRWGGHCRTPAAPTGSASPGGFAPPLWERRVLSPQTRVPPTSPLHPEPPPRALAP